MSPDDCLIYTCRIEEATWPTFFLVVVGVALYFLIARWLIRRR